jgi:hypothetical protein
MPESSKNLIFEGRRDQQEESDIGWINLLVLFFSIFLFFLLLPSLDPPGLLLFSFLFVASRDPSPPHSIRHSEKKTLSNRRAIQVPYLANLVSSNMSGGFASASVRLSTSVESPRIVVCRCPRSVPDFN